VKVRGGEVVYKGLIRAKAGVGARVAAGAGAGLGAEGEPKQEFTLWNRSLLTLDRDSPFTMSH
jgi:hypothetical protein